MDILYSFKTISKATLILLVLCLFGTIFIYHDDYFIRLRIIIWTIILEGKKISYDLMITMRCLIL